MALYRDMALRLSASSPPLFFICCTDASALAMRTLLSQINAYSNWFFLSVPEPRLDRKTCLFQSIGLSDISSFNACAKACESIGILSEEAESLDRICQIACFKNGQLTKNWNLGSEQLPDDALVDMLKKYNG